MVGTGGGDLLDLCTGYGPWCTGCLTQEGPRVCSIRMDVSAVPIWSRGLEDSWRDAGLLLCVGSLKELDLILVKEEDKIVASKSVSKQGKTNVLLSWLYI